MSESIDQNAQQNPEQDSAINMRELMFLCLSRWYWFAISLFICLALAVVYILRTPPVYTQTAQILIKETSKSRASSMTVSESFQNFGMFTSNVNISNEIITLQSTMTMEEVVKRLKLDMNYYAPGSWHDVTLYGNTLPVDVELPDISNTSSASFKLKLQPGGQYTVSDFKLDKEKFGDKPIEGILADTIATPLGVMVVKPSKFYKAEDEGEIMVKRTSLDRAVMRYCKELNVAQSEEKSSVIVLSVSDVSLRRADDILATLIAVYNENWVKDKNQIAVSTSMFINDRLGIIEGELGNVDSDISSFKSEHLIPDVESAASMYMNQATQAQNNIQDLNNKVYMARYIRNYLANEANDTQVLPVTSGVDNASLAAQIADYNTKMLERNSLVSYSSDKNPLIVEMDKGLKELRQSMIASIDNQLVALNAQIASFQNAAGRATSQIASNPGQAKYLLSVERQQKVKESLYLYLLQKREENELSQAFTAYNTRTIENPGGSKIPTSPKKAQILLIAFVLGLVIPIGIIYLREMFNTVVRGRKDLESLSLPFVGEIPDAPAGKGKKGKLGHSADAIVVKQGSRNIINEAFRVVRTNLEFMLGPGHHIIAITSANPGSGKTFISMNLADALALKNKRVIAIDLDLRKGSLSKYAPKMRVGIADYLADRVHDFDEIIIKNVADTNVDIVPVGTLPPNPTELLFSPLLPELLETLKAHYDYVFLDCPPVEVVADASIINKLADKTLFIIRAGLFERAMLPEVERFYTSGRYKNLCLILNGTDGGSKHGYRYGYKYGYQYGYKYGYSNDDDKQKID